MNSNIIITLPEEEHERLHELALAYGLSLEELSSRVLKIVSRNIPEENIEDYKNPKIVQLSLNRALRDLRAGRIHSPV